jgi:hypothetical protein
MRAHQLADLETFRQAAKTDRFATANPSGGGLAACAPRKFRDRSLLRLLGENLKPRIGSQLIKHGVN